MLGVDVVRVVGKGMVERVETEDLLETVVRIDMLVRLVGLLGRWVPMMTEPGGPVRYQFAGESPRHSPTVTARYPLENSDVRM